MLFWLDEWTESPSERAERQRLVEANKAKWGAILRERDTFDDSVVPSGSREAAKSSGEWVLVGLSAPILAALVTKAVGLW